MRVLRSLFGGLLALAAFGGAVAHAQESSSRYWVNPAWIGVSRGEAALVLGAQPVNRAADLALGFTITGYAGISGRLELGRIALGPGSEAGSMPSLAYPGVALSPVEQTVGEASIRWNVTPRFAVATSYSRDMADPLLSDGGVPVFEDTIAGSVTYAITPRFAVSARAALSIPSDTSLQDAADFSGDGAELGAAYQFMPYFTGSVNYTYQSYDGQQGVLRHDESTLSLSLTGRF